MSLSSSLKPARTLLGTVAEDSVRCGHSVENVPRSEAGLKCLAADGNWSAVAQLAEQLRAATSDSTPDGLSKKLQYALAQVTANFYMRRYGAARKVMECLGDLNDDRYRDPVTKESLVPFSLRFVVAILPLYCGSKIDSQKLLYDLLEECRRCAGVSAPPLWMDRIKRIQRALVVCHYQVEQYSVALRVFRETIMVEGYSEEGKVRSHILLRQMLHFQQFATLALHCGNALLARSIFEGIERMNTSEANPDVMKFHECLVKYNKGIWLTFNGRLGDSHKIFHEVAKCTRETYCGLQKVEELPTHVSTVCSRRIEACSDKWDVLATSELCRHAFHQLQVSATTSHVATMPYEGRECKALANPLLDTIKTMENYLRVDPVGLLASDAFLSNGVRLYTLEGDTRQKKIDILVDLVEVFRCDRGSAPQMDSLA